MSSQLKILFAEDSPQDVELALRELRRAGIEPAWQRVDTEAAYLGQLNPGLDLIISDYAMPQFSGLRALDLLRQRRLDIPFILVSGTIGEDLAVQAMKNGASDYLLKDRLTRLGPAATHALDQSRLRRERREADEKIRRQLDELLRWQEVMLNREDRVLTLKAEVNELLRRLGEPPHYSDPP